LLGLPVQIKFFSDHGAVPPRQAHKGDAGADLRAAVNRPITIEPGARRRISTGFQIELPRGFEAQIRPRSGLALRHGVTVLNTPGTIDSGYRGYVDVILANLGDEPFEVEPGMRIAQMVVAPYARTSFHGVGTLAESERGAGGFGSTGK
jgi:dUTP pyrophosphatase